MALAAVRRAMGTSSVSVAKSGMSRPAMVNLRLVSGSRGEGVWLDPGLDVVGSDMRSDSLQQGLLQVLDMFLRRHVERRQEKSDLRAQLLYAPGRDPSLLVLVTERWRRVLWCLTLVPLVSRPFAGHSPLSPWKKVVGDRAKHRHDTSINGYETIIERCAFAWVGGGLCAAFSGDEIRKRVLGLGARHDVGGVILLHCPLRFQPFTKLLEQ
jgi:hypothetical protein